MPNTTSPPDKSLLKQLTPVIVVDRIESCLDFWVNRLGFEVTNRVPAPDGDLVFASMQRDAVEIMYQTRASVAHDLPETASELNGHSITLFITVDDIDHIERALKDAPVVKPRHQTFYGSTEIYVREPGGNIVGFAQFP